MAYRTTSDGTSFRPGQPRVSDWVSPGGPASRLAASHLQGPNALTTHVLDHLLSLVPQQYRARPGARRQFRNLFWPGSAYRETVPPSTPGLVIFDCDGVLVDT